MNVLTCGLGVNSSAMIIECIKRKIPLDIIIFANTGGETPETYAQFDILSLYLIKHGYPSIQMVRRVNKDHKHETLEEECLRMHCLPSIAYGGFKTCSQKYKIAPVDKYLNNLQPAKDIWAKGGKITKFVGFDADESHRIKDFDDKKYDVRYPLVEWDMGRDECVESIKSAGLCVPPKSSCWFCPSMRVHEIRNLALQHKDLADRAIAMEENAELTHIAGLGRSFSWKNLLSTDDMFEDNCIEIDCGCYDG